MINPQKSYFILKMTIHFLLVPFPPQGRFICDKSIAGEVGFYHFCYKTVIISIQTMSPISPRGMFCFYIKTEQENGGNQRTLVKLLKTILNKFININDNTILKYKSTKFLINLRFITPNVLFCFYIKTEQGL